MTATLVRLPTSTIDETQRSLLILFSVLPPAVLNFMVAERYGQEPHRVASIVLVGNLTSVAVIPATLWFIL